MASKGIYALIKQSGILVYGLIIAAALIFCARACNLISTNKEDQQSPLRVYPEFEDIDEMRKEKWYTDKEMIDIIWKNQKVLNSRYDNMLADLRQESNNAIEKVSAELNFWVAVLAFLGVLVPIAVTFKGENDLKERFESKFEDLNLRLSTFLKSAGYQVNSWHDKFQEILSSSKKIDKMKKELDLEMNSICLTSIRNNRLLESQSDLLMAQRFLAHETIKKFLKFFEEEIYNEANYQSSDKKWNLVKYSMQYYDMLRTLSVDYQGRVKQREFNNGEKAAKNMVLTLMEDFPDEESIKTQFAEVKKTTKTILKNILLSE